jgi:hypothetical protein
VHLASCRKRFTSAGCAGACRATSSRVARASISAAWGGTLRPPKRPVTPEVAGSSPVAPVEIPANRHVVLSVQTPGRSQLHTLFSRRRQKAQNGPKCGRGVAVSSRFEVELTLLATAPCEYTKRPEVNAPPARVPGGPSSRAAAQGSLSVFSVARARGSSLTLSTLACGWYADRQDRRSCPKLAS